MATCLTSINGADSQLIELSSDVTYSATINNTENALYLLANELDQSVFFTIRVLGVTSNISITLTIYNETTLASFGSLTINQSSTSSSFNIKAGRYYVCIRSQVFPYNIELVPKFISYNKTATFTPKSYLGITSVGELKTAQMANIVCRRRLVYEIVEGGLPTGLTMLENGYISGYLPILDTDSFNDDLPPSNTWYHKVGDSAYVTNWGRAYRFKVKLTLFDDKSKTDIRWFYISIINDYSKNLALVDKYEMLDDDRDVTFEEKIKLDTSLCPPCGNTQLVNNMANINNQTIDDTINQPDYSDISVNNAINSKDTSKLFDLVESNIVEDTDIDNKNVLLFNTDFNKNNGEFSQAIEMIKIPDSGDIVFDGDTPIFKNINMIKVNSSKVNNISDMQSKGLAEYYISNFDRDEYDFIAHLKDSTMYQIYLKENNISDKFILEFPMMREDYTNIKLEYTAVMDEITKVVSRYIKLIALGKSANTNDNTINDATDAFVEKYKDNYSKLPLTPYNIYGWAVITNLFVEGK